MQTAAPIPTFMDFEASSLNSASYPIEVAWSRADGSIESHLISPAGVDGWGDWGARAQAVHGITRAELSTSGRPPVWVCRRMLGQIGDARVVYTDCPEFDGTWLAELFKAAAVTPPGFVIGHVYDLLVRTLCPAACGWAEVDELIAELKREARARVPSEHRAGWDVRYLVELWQLAAGRAAGSHNDGRGRGLQPSPGGCAV